MTPSTRANQKLRPGNLKRANPKSTTACLYSGGWRGLSTHLAISVESVYQLRWFGSHRPIFMNDSV